MAGQMTEARRKYLSDIGKARFAALPKNGACRKCKTPIVDRFTFCKECWTNLSDDQRSAINAHFVLGAYPSQQKNPAYWAAIEEACK